LFALLVAGTSLAKYFALKAFNEKNQIDLNNRIRDVVSIDRN